MGKYRVTNTTIDRKDSANFTEADVLAQARIDEVLIAENIGKLTKEGQEKFLELQREIPDNLSPAQRSLQVAKNITEVSRQKEYRANQKLSEEEAALLRLRSSLIANALTQEFSPYRNEDGSINMEKFNADMEAAGLAISALELETGTGGTGTGGTGTGGQGGQGGTGNKNMGSGVTLLDPKKNKNTNTDTDSDGTDDKTDDIIQAAQAVTDAVNENPLLRTTVGEYFNQVKQAANDPNISKLDVTEIALGGLANQIKRGGGGAADLATETVWPWMKGMGEYVYDFYALSPTEYQATYGAQSYDQTKRLVEGMDEGVGSFFWTRRNIEDTTPEEASLLAANRARTQNKERDLAGIRSLIEQQAVDFQTQVIKDYSQTNAQSVSDTVDVVGALLNDTPTGIEFMKRVVNAESEFGQHPDTYNVQGKKGSRSRWGVAQVTEKAFNHVQNRLKSGNAKIARYIKPIQEATGIDLREVTFEDMNNPLISILYGRLYVMQKTKKPIPKTIDGQGAYYEEIYSGIDGTGNFFVRRNLPTGRPVDDRIASAE